MSIDICIPFDIPPVLHYAAPGAQERSIIWQHYPPDMTALILCSWVIAKAISSMLVSHQISLFPSSKIRMFSMCHCIESMSWQIKLLITLLPFLNIDTWAVSFKSKGGSILASQPACMSTCKCLQTVWPQMTAEIAILPIQTVLRSEKQKEKKKKITLGDDRKIESQSTRNKTNLTRLSWPVVPAKVMPHQLAPAHGQPHVPFAHS